MSWGLCISGPDEHVPAGDPGGGHHPALVLPGSHHRPEQTAAQEPGGEPGGLAPSQTTALCWFWKNNPFQVTTPLYLLNVIG